MSWLHTNTDWNGDGRYDIQDDVIDTMIRMDRLDEMERDERIGKMVNAIRLDGSPVIDNGIFERLCSGLGYRMSDFTQADIDELQRRLNQ